MSAHCDAESLNLCNVIAILKSSVHRLRVCLFLFNHWFLRFHTVLVQFTALHARKGVGHRGEARHVLFTIRDGYKSHCTAGSFIIALHFGFFACDHPRSQCCRRWAPHRPWSHVIAHFFHMKVSIFSKSVLRCCFVDEALKLCPRTLFRTPRSTASRPRSREAAR